MVEHHCERRCVGEEAVVEAVIQHPHESVGLSGLEEETGNGVGRRRHHCDGLRRAPELVQLRRRRCNKSSLLYLTIASIQNQVSNVRGMAKPNDNVDGAKNTKILLQHLPAPPGARARPHY